MSSSDVANTGKIMTTTKVIVERLNSLDEWEGTELENIMSFNISTSRKYASSTLTLNIQDKYGSQTIGDTGKHESLYSWTNSNSSLNWLPSFSRLEYPFNFVSDVDSQTNTEGSTLKLSKMESDNTKYNTYGKWISKSIEAVEYVRWINLDCDVSKLSQSCSIDILVRFSSDNVIWTSWECVLSLSSNSFENINKAWLSNQMKYMQVQIELRSNNQINTPEIKSLKGYYYSGPMTSNTPSPLLYYGNRVILEEGYVDSDNTIKWIRKFYGVINNVTSSTNRNNSTITVEATDFMKYLVDGIIEKPRYFTGDPPPAPFNTTDLSKPFECKQISQDWIELEPVYVLTESKDAPANPKATDCFTYKDNNGKDVVFKFDGTRWVEITNENEKKAILYSGPISVEQRGKAWRIPYGQYRGNRTVTNLTVDDNGTFIVRPNGDMKYQNWSKYPRPEIKVHYWEIPDVASARGATGITEHDIKLYEDCWIDYAKGIVYTSRTDIYSIPWNWEAQDFWGNWETGTVPGAKMSVAFQWYDMDTNKFEDVVATLIKMAYADAGLVPKIEDWHIAQKVGDAWQAVADDLTAYNNLYTNGDGNDRPKITWIAKGIDKRDYLIQLDLSYPRAVIPRTFFSIEDNKSYWEAINSLLKFVDPSYRIYADEYGRIIGRYNWQKQIASQADKTLFLVKNVDLPVTSDNIFTKIITFGRKETNHNACANAVVAVCPMPEEFKVSISGVHSHDQEHTPRQGILAKMGIIVDGKFDDSFIFQTNKEKSIDDNLPLDLFTIKLQESVYISRIDLCWGENYDGTSTDGMGYAVDVSPNGTDWYSLTTEFEEKTGSTSTWSSFDESEVDEYIKFLKVKYLKIKGTKFGETDGDWYWSTKEIRVWPRDVLRADVAITDDIIASNQYPLPDRHINKEKAKMLVKRIGTRTKVMPINEGLLTSDDVSNRGANLLYDIARDLYKAKVEVLYDPTIDIGQTVILEGPDTGYLNQADKLYMVESYTFSKQGKNPNMVVDLVCWD